MSSLGSVQMIMQNRCPKFGFTFKLLFVQFQTQSLILGEKVKIVLQWCGAAVRLVQLCPCTMATYRTALLTQKFATLAADLCVDKVARHGGALDRVARLGTRIWCRGWGMNRSHPGTADDGTASATVRFALFYRVRLSIRHSPYYGF